MSSRSRERRLDVGDGEIRVLEWGTRSAPRSIIALHGFSQTADYFQALADALALIGEFHLVAPDLRAHGESDNFVTGPADTVFVLDAIRMWEATTERPATWFGNSLGARIAALSCVRRPEIAARLVLGECLVGLERIWTMLLAGTRRYARGRPPRFETLADAKRFSTEVRRDSARAQLLWLAHAIAANDDGSLREKLRTDYLESSFWPDHSAEIVDQLKTISVPVVLLYGALTSALSPPQREAVKALLPTATIGLVEGASHDLFIDAPEALAALLHGDSP